MPSWLEFDLHGRCAIRIPADAPTTPQLLDMFAPFVATGLGPPDVMVASSWEPLEVPSHGEHEYRYNDRGVFIEALTIQIERANKVWRVGGTRELLTAVLPLIDSVMVGRGAAMVHAATFELYGHGVCMGAWGGVGKTSTVAKLLKLGDVAFMGDDWAFVSTAGELLGYAKPMFIKPYHRPIYPHLFAAKKKPLVPPRWSKRIARTTTLVHPLVTRYPRLARAVRRFSPEYLQVTPSTAFPDARIAERASLDLLTFVERYDGTKTRVEERDGRWMTSKLICNFHAELSRPSRDVIDALSACGLLPIEQMFEEKRAVVAAAVAAKPCCLIRVPAKMSADEASTSIVENIQKTFADVGLV